MRSFVEPLEGNKVKVCVEVDEVEFETDINAAFRKIALEVRLPGFRPGKAPRKVLESRIGLAPARQQALQDGLSGYLARAVKENSVDIIAPPEVEVTAGEEAGPISFEAIVQVRPKVLVPGYAGLRVEMPSPELTDDEAKGPIDNELRRHGSLQAVERPAVRGDQVTIDLAAHRDGEPVAGLNTDDWLYEVGKGWVAAGFDDELVGTTPGDTKTFTSLPSGTDDPAEFTFTVKGVQEMVLPELTDEWVADNVGEFNTVEAWKASARDRLSLMKRAQASRALVEQTTSALADLVDDEMPEALINHDFQYRAQNFIEQIQSQGIPFEQYLQITGQDQKQLIDSIRESSVRAVKVDVALRAVADAEGLSADDDDVAAEYERIASQVGQKVQAVRKAYEKNDGVDDLKTELRKRKAMDLLLDRVEVVDPEGHPIERSLFMLNSDSVGGEEA